jgi:CO/xanthine dehydrogenase Mo-binding subunit
LVIGFYLSGLPPEGSTPINAWVQIVPNDSVTLLVDKSEMGQGISTALVMILADELDLDWKKVKTEFAPTAAQYFKESAKFPVPVNPKPKDPQNYKYVGKPSPRIDSPEESNGKAQFAIDVRLPGMLQDGLWPLRESRNHSRPSAALKGEITIANGRVEQSTFNNYDLLRINQTPQSEVHIAQSADGPVGIGEPGTPPIAPAVCNAIFAATGKPVRRLPIRAEDLA